MRSMCGVRWRGSAAWLALLGVLLAACGGPKSTPTGTAIDLPTGRFGYGYSYATGQEARFSFNIFSTPIKGNRDRIHVLSITLLNLPNGIHIDGVWGEKAAADGVLAVNPPSPNDGGGGIPPSSIVLDPTCPIKARCAPTEYGDTDRLQQWTLVIYAHITRLGDFKTTGIRVVYDVAGQRYQQITPCFIELSSAGITL